MKIAVLGPHQVGKTTLVEALAKKLDLPVFPENARQLLTDLLPGGIYSWRDGKLTNAEWILFQATISLLHADQVNSASFVSDRTVLDGLGYIAVYSYDRKFVGYERVVLSRIVSAVNSLVASVEYDVVIRVTLGEPVAKLVEEDPNIKLLDAYYAENFHKLRAKRYITCSAYPDANEIANKIQRGPINL